MNVALVGAGYWGPNWARNLAKAEGARFHALCDADPARLADVGGKYPGVRREADYAALLRDPDLDAVVLATPVATHYRLARAALEAGKHVLVEKPLATTVKECEDLVDLARAQGRNLMVGHTFVYSAPVRRLAEIVREGRLGDVLYLYSQRLNLGQLRHDVNALWNVGPHDLSIFHHVLGAWPERVAARGYAYLQPGVEDVVWMTLEYAGGVAAHVHMSWLDPAKTRRTVVVGRERMAVYDDTSKDAPLVVHDKRIVKEVGRWVHHGGEAVVERVSLVEPMAAELAEFVASVRERRPPLTSGQEGLEVTRVLVAAKRSMAEGGTRVPVSKA